MEIPTMKTTKIFNNKKILLILAMATIFAIIATALSMSSVVNASAYNVDDYTKYNICALRYHIEIDGVHTTTSSLDKFIETIEHETPIQVFFELQDCRWQPTSPANTLSTLATTSEVNRVMAKHTENLRRFHTARNLAFLEQHDIARYSYYYSLSVSYFSPHILKTFNNATTFKNFKAFNSSLNSASSNSIVQRISVTEISHSNGDATVQEPAANVPRYYMSQVRQDIGILCDTFTGTGINVGMIESGFPTINPRHEQLRHLSMYLGGGTSRAHATGVARTFVGSIGIAPNVEALHAFGLYRTNIEAMNWFLSPKENGRPRNVRIINVSYGHPSGYCYWAAFFDWHSRNHNITFVAATHNQGMSSVTSPATGFNVISVGSTNANGNVSSYSNFGQWPELNTRNPTLVAPGTRLQSTLGGCCGHVNGCASTSIAAPVVSGVVARLMQEFPILQTRPDMVKAVLMASATPVNGQSINTWCNIAGAGRVHYERAREAARNAIAFELAATTNTNNQIRFSHNITTTPNAQIRVAAFWQANSITDGNTYDVIPNIHTRYELRIRGTNSFDNHVSNIQLATHITASSQYTIDLIQRSNRHARNTKPDRGAIAWIYEPLIFERIAGTYNARVRASSGVTSTNITIPQRVTLNGTNLTVTAIAPNGFAGQRNIESIYIPASVSYIGRFAFASSSGLRTIWLPIGSGGPSAIPQIDSLTFTGTNRQNIALVISFGLNSSYIARGWSGFNFLSMRSIVNPQTNRFENTAFSLERQPGFNGTLIIPHGVQVIGASVFANNRYIQDITIPSSVSSIGAHSFNIGRDLSTIRMQHTVESSIPFITNTAFMGNRASITVVVPNGTRQRFINRGWTGFNLLTVEEYELPPPSPQLLATGQCDNPRSGSIYLDIDFNELQGRVIKLVHSVPSWQNGSEYKLMHYSLFIFSSQLSFELLSGAHLIFRWHAPNVLRIWRPTGGSTGSSSFSVSLYCMGDSPRQSPILFSVATTSGGSSNAALPVCEQLLYNLCI